MVGCDDSASDVASSEVSICNTVGTSWLSQSFAEQTGRFHVEFAVTPSRNNLDAVVGLSRGPASGWTGLAAIVRFNPQGMIDARNGGAYQAAVAVPYQAGTTYYVRFDVDLAAHTYTTRVGTQPGAFTWTIGTNFSFRTEQASVTSLDHLSSYVNVTPGGSMQVCDLAVVSDQPPQGCTSQSLSSGYVNRPTTASTTVQIVSLDARASVVGVDGVIGVANGPVDAFADFAVSMRFGPTGYIEARDGDTYRADRVIGYEAGRQYSLYFVIDLPSKTYSLFLRNYPGYTEDVEIAHGYRFRTQQATTSRLDHVASIVDRTGTLEVCSLRAGPNAKLLSARPGGIFDVHPFPNGSALLSDPNRTTRVDANNVPIGSVEMGGNVTADAAGNFYVSSIASDYTLQVHAYTAGFVHRWSQFYPTPGASTVLDSVITSAGHVAVAVGDGTGTPLAVLLIDSFGPYRGVTNLFPGTTAIAMTPNGFATTMTFPESYGYPGYEIQIWRHGAPGGMTRSRQIRGEVDASKISLAPDDSVVVGGRLRSGPMTFDECTIAPQPFPEGTWDAYVTAFRPDLFTRFCKRLTTEVTGIASDTSRIAVAYHTITQLFYVDTAVYDWAGNRIGGSSEDAFVGSFGKPAGVALAADGRLYLQEFVSFMSPSEQRWPFLVTIRP